jgi:hypothetical protein
MPAFILRDRKHQPFGAPVEYRPLRVVVGNVTHELALHEMYGWTVSDPASGGRVLNVAGSMQGVRVSSAGMGPREATQRARAQVVALAESVGIDAFNARLVAVRAEVAS